jgi:dTDP-4-amino-4,6-dideoxygalactose transaminase
MHQQPVFRAYDRIGGDVADDIFERGLCLPSGSSLTREQLDRVVAIVRDTCRPAVASPSSRLRARVNS